MGKNKILKELTASLCEMAKQTIAITYTCIDSLILYNVAPFWTLFLRDTKWKDT